MKRSKTMSFDLDLAGNATGFAAISLACANIFEKLKGVFGNGSHGHSGIHATGVIHVECTESIEFDVEEAKLAYEIDREYTEKMPDDAAKFVAAATQVAEFLRDEAKHVVRTTGEIKDLVEEIFVDDDLEEPKKKSSKSKN